MLKKVLFDIFNIFKVTLMTLLSKIKIDVPRRRDLYVI